MTPQYFYSCTSNHSHVIPSVLNINPKPATMVAVIQGDQSICGWHKSTYKVSVIVYINFVWDFFWEGSNCLTFVFSLYLVACALSEKQKTKKEGKKNWKKKGILKKGKGKGEGERGWEEGGWGRGRARQRKSLSYAFYSIFSNVFILSPYLCRDEILKDGESLEGCAILQLGKNAIRMDHCLLLNDPWSVVPLSKLKKWKHMFLKRKCCWNN